MEIIEKCMNLFDVDTNKYVFAHNISCDCEMGKGIVVEFIKKHKHLKDECINYSHSKNQLVIGTSYRHSDQNGTVYNLFTKQRYYFKSDRYMTYTEYMNNLYNCLLDLRMQMIDNNENYLAIPKIGCGLDHCKWRDVKSILEKVFKNTTIEILVCYI